MAEPDGIVLLLFVANDAPKSIIAMENMRRALAELGEGSGERPFALEIINVFDDPDRALASRVLVTPTLLAPASARRLVGDLSQKAQLLYFLQGLVVPLAS